jgi:hypothetical protein
MESDGSSWDFDIVDGGQVHMKIHVTIESFVKYVQKRKLRANFIKTGVSSSQGAKRSLVVVFQQV